MTTSEDTVLRVRSSVTWREVDGEVIALDLETSTYFTTNRSGTFLWHHLVSGATRNGLVDDLAGKFGIPEEVAAVDVRSFLRLLADHNLLDRPD